MHETCGMQIDGAEGATHKFLKQRDEKQRGYVWNDRSEVASHAQKETRILRR